jgi:hypothetical protein
MIVARRLLGQFVSAKHEHDRGTNEYYLRAATFAQWVSIPDTAGCAKVAAQRQSAHCLPLPATIATAVLLLQLQQKAK